MTRGTSVRARSGPAARVRAVRLLGHRTDADLRDAAEARGLRRERPDLNGAREIVARERRRADLCPTAEPGSGIDDPDLRKTGEAGPLVVLGIEERIAGP